MPCVFACVRQLIVLSIALLALLSVAVCRRSGGRLLSGFFFLETSVISAPICAETLSDENKASLLRFCLSPPLTPLHPHALHPPSAPPRVSVSPQDEIAPRRMPDDPL